MDIKEIINNTKEKVVKEWTRPVPQTFGGIIESKLFSELVDIFIVTPIVTIIAQKFNGGDNNE